MLLRHTWLRWGYGPPDPLYRTTFSASSKGGVLFVSERLQVWLPLSIAWWLHWCRCFSRKRSLFRYGAPENSEVLPRKLIYKCIKHCRIPGRSATTVFTRRLTNSGLSVWKNNPIGCKRSPSCRSCPPVTLLPGEKAVWDDPRHVRSASASPFPKPRNSI